MPSCPPAWDVNITCSDLPACTYAGDVVSVDGKCAVTSGPYAGTPVALFNASDRQPVTNVT